MVHLGVLLHLLVCVDGSILYVRGYLHIGGHGEQRLQRKRHSCSVPLPSAAQSIFRLLAVFTASFWTSAARCLSTSVILRGFGARMSSLLYPGTRMFQLRSNYERRQQMYK